MLSRLVEENPSKGEEGSEESGEGRSGRDGGEEGTEEVRRFPIFKWLAAIEAVSEATRFDFNEIYRLSVLEFWGYCRYIDWRNRRRQAEIDRLQGKNRIA